MKLLGCVLVLLLACSANAGGLRGRMTSTFPFVDRRLSEDISCHIPEQWRGDATTNTFKKIGTEAAKGSVGLVTKLAGNHVGKLAKITTPLTGLMKAGKSIAGVLSNPGVGFAAGIVMNMILPDANARSFKQLRHAVGCLDGRMDKLNDKITDLADKIGDVKENLEIETWRSNGVDALLVKKNMNDVRDDLHILEQHFRSDLNVANICVNPKGGIIFGANAAIGVTKFMCTCETIMRDYNPLSSQWKDSMVLLDVTSNKLRELLETLSMPVLLSSDFVQNNKAAFWDATRTLIEQYAKVVLEATNAYSSLTMWTRTERIQSEKDASDNCLSEDYSPDKRVENLRSTARKCATSSACQPKLILEAMKTDIERNVIGQIDELVKTLRNTWTARTASREITDRIDGPHQRKVPDQDTSWFNSENWRYSTTSPSATKGCFGDYAQSGKTLTQCKNGQPLTKDTIKLLMYNDLVAQNHHAVYSVADYGKRQWMNPKALPEEKDLVQFDGVSCTMSAKIKYGHGVYVPASCTFNELYDPLYLEIKAILPSLKLEAKAFLEATEIYKASEKAVEDGKESICGYFTSSFTAEELEASFAPHVWAPSTTNEVVGYGKFEAVELELDIVEDTAPVCGGKKVTTGPIPVATPSPAPEWLESFEGFTDLRRHERVTLKKCKSLCAAAPACHGVSRRRAAAPTAKATCWLESASPNPADRPGTGYITLLKPASGAVKAPTCPVARTCRCGGNCGHCGYGCSGGPSSNSCQACREWKKSHGLSPSGSGASWSDWVRNPSGLRLSLVSGYRGTRG